MYGYLAIIFLFYADLVKCEHTSKTQKAAATTYLQVKEEPLFNFTLADFQRNTENFSETLHHEEEIPISINITAGIQNYSYPTDTTLKTTYNQENQVKEATANYTIQSADGMQEYLDNLRRNVPNNLPSTVTNKAIFDQFSNVLYNTIQEKITMQEYSTKRSTNSSEEIDKHFNSPPMNSTYNNLKIKLSLKVQTGKEEHKPPRERGSSLQFKSDLINTTGQPNIIQIPFQNSGALIPLILQQIDQNQKLKSSLKYKKISDSNATLQILIAIISNDKKSDVNETNSNTPKPLAEENTTDLNKESDSTFADEIVSNKGEINENTSIVETKTDEYQQIATDVSNEIVAKRSSVNHSDSIEHHNDNSTHLVSAPKRDIKYVSRKKNQNFENIDNTGIKTQKKNCSSEVNQSSACDLVNSTKHSEDYNSVEKAPKTTISLLDEENETERHISIESDNSNYTERLEQYQNISPLESHNKSADLHKTENEEQGLSIFKIFKDEVHMEELNPEHVIQKRIRKDTIHRDYLTQVFDTRSNVHPTENLTNEVPSNLNSYNTNDIKVQHHSNNDIIHDQDLNKLMHASKGANILSKIHSSVVYTDNSNTVVSDKPNNVYTDVSNITPKKPNTTHSKSFYSIVLSKNQVESPNLRISMLPKSNPPANSFDPKPVRPAGRPEDIPLNDSFHKRDPVFMMALQTSLLDYILKRFFFGPVVSIRSKRKSARKLNQFDPLHEHFILNAIHGDEGVINENFFFEPKHNAKLTFGKRKSERRKRHFVLKKNVTSREHVQGNNVIKMHLWGHNEDKTTESEQKTSSSFGNDEFMETKDSLRAKRSNEVSENDTRTATTFQENLRLLVFYKREKLFNCTPGFVLSMLICIILLYYILQKSGWCCKTPEVVGEVHGKKLHSNVRPAELQNTLG